MQHEHILVFSLFTSRPNSLLLYFSLWYLCLRSVYLHWQHRPGAKGFIQFQSLPTFLGLPDIIYWSKVEKNCNKTSGNIFLLRNLLWFSFKHVLLNV